MVDVFLIGFHDLQWLQDLSPQLYLYLSIYIEYIKNHIVLVNWIGGRQGNLGHSGGAGENDPHERNCLVKGQSEAIIKDEEATTFSLLVAS